MSIPSDLYNTDYFLSDRCEGYEYFVEGQLSRVKQYEIEQLDLAPGLSVLDAGCGRGEVLRACASAGASVAGVDYSEAAVELTRKTLADLGGIDIRRADVTALPWADDSFDRILCADVIEHVEPAQAADAVGEFLRVLRPDGLLLVHTAPNRLFRKAWPALRPVVRLVGAGEAARHLDEYLESVLEYHVNEQSLGGLRRLMRPAGFVDVKVWVHQDVIRSGTHRLTRDLGESRVVSLGSRLAGVWPLRLVLGNDLYARGRKPSARQRV